MLIIDSEKCVCCGDCVNECHRSALSILDNELNWDEEKCYGCGHCMAICPRDAVFLHGDGYDVNDVEEFYNLRPRMEQVREMIMMRRSIRSFTDMEVTDEELDKILEAGKYSPTAENKQGNVFLVVRDIDKRQEMLDDCMGMLDSVCDDVLSGKSNKFSEILAGNLKNVAKNWRENQEDGLFYGAPLFIFIFSDTIQDGTIAAATMTNMAYGLKLGACYIRIASDLFEDGTLMKKYNIPEGKIPSMALAIGDPQVEFFSSVPRKNPLTIIL